MFGFAVPALVSNVFRFFSTPLGQFIGVAMLIVLLMAGTHWRATNKANTRWEVKIEKAQEAEKLRQARITKEILETADKRALQAEQELQKAQELLDDYLSELEEVEGGGDCDCSVNKHDVDRLRNILQGTTGRN